MMLDKREFLRGARVLCRSGKDSNAAMKNCIFPVHRFFPVLILFLSSTVFFLLPCLSLGEEQPKRPRIGLVLGGGGAKGAAHIGVLKVLEELKIPIDYIAGTSMGAVVGGLYASGMSPEEIEQVLTSVDWDDLFTDEPPRSEIDFKRKREDFSILFAEFGFKKGRLRTPRAFIAGQKIGLLFEGLFMPVSNIKDFDKLPTPYRAVASDLETGKAVVLKSGRLPDAARASMSVPGVFPPVEVDGHLLADGGIVRNLPVDIVRAMGADIIIAVDVGKPLLPKEELIFYPAIMNQMVDIMIKENVKAQIDKLNEKDVFIRPDLGTISSGDFARGKEAIERGVKAAQDKEGDLRRLSVTDAEYLPYLQEHERKPIKSLHVGSVAITGLVRVSPESVKFKLGVREGEEISVAELNHQVGLVYGMGDFEQVALEAQRRDNTDTYDLSVRAQEKSWGPDYFRFGLSLESSTGGDSDFNILGDYTMRWFNKLGAEWKNQLQYGSQKRFLSEFYQPLEYTRTFFVAPHVNWNQSYYDLYQGNDIIAQYQLTRTTAGIDFGIQPWTYGDIRLGYQGGTANLEIHRGTFDLPRENVDLSGIRFLAIADQLDNVHFPHSGYFGVIDFYSSQPELGADDRYQKLTVSLSKAFTYRSYTLVASGRFDTSISGRLPFYETFTLGGLWNMSGYQKDQLRGQKAGIGRLISYWKVAHSLFGDFYVGGSLEAGNVWQTGESPAFDDLLLAGSIFMGYDTLLGPVYVAFGTAEEGRPLLYLYLGRIF
jgi:NTE family protein